MFFIPLFSSNLTTKKIGHKIEYFRVINSTNKIIYEMFENNEVQSGALVIADEQTEGKGRCGKKWFSQSGKSLTFSLIIKNDTPLLIKKLPLVSGIAIVEGIKKLTKVNCSLKWPNDIFYQSQKLGGILIEQKKNHFIIGIGINVNDDNLNTSIENGISLQSILQYTIQREPLLAFICNNIEELLELDMDEIINQWESICSHMNSFIKFHDYKKIINGKFIGLNQNGEASLELNKKIQFFHSGTIEL